MRPDKYSISYWLGVTVTAILAALGAAQVAAPQLGLSTAQLAALGIAAAFLGVLNGALPRVTKPPAQERAGKD